MTNSYEFRRSESRKSLLENLPKMQYDPLVGEFHLQEIIKVFRGLPELNFPINSAGELIEKLGGSERMLNIAEVEVNPLRMIKHMPAYYFPITSIENMVEKMAELIRANQKSFDVNKVVEQLRNSLPQIPYPINNADEFLRALGARQEYNFMGERINPAEMLKSVPERFFPVRGQEDLEKKVLLMLHSRPLLVKD